MVICLYLRPKQKRSDGPRPGQAQVTDICMVEVGSTIGEGEVTDGACDAGTDHGDGGTVDIGLLNVSRLTDTERRSILEQKWVPPRGFVFPRNKHNRK